MEAASARLRSPRNSDAMRDWSPPISADLGYVELKRRLKQEGVFDRQYAFYAMQAVVAVGLFVLSLGLLFVLEPFWLKLLDAVLLTIAFVQVGYLLHDAGHRQIFAKPRHNDMVMLVAGFLLGASRSWWFDMHNAHHAHPNDLDLDPNTALPVLAFSEEQALGKPGVLRFVVGFQAFYFLPLLSLEGLGTRLASVVHIAGGRARYPVVETVGMTVHVVLLVAIALLAMPWWQAAIFLLANQLIAGFYLGAIFAPNHKGTLVPTADDGLGFLEHQVLSSRNIHPSPAIDFLYGGLNYQIEHHLYPSIPRNNLPRTRRIVRQFCEERGLAYQETGMIASYVEVLSYFHRVSRPLRSRSAREAFMARRERAVEVPADA